jgi:hypothetical protein
MMSLSFTLSLSNIHIQCYTYVSMPRAYSITKRQKSKKSKSGMEGTRLVGYQSRFPSAGERQLGTRVFLVTTGCVRSVFEQLVWVEVEVWFVKSGWWGVMCCDMIVDGCGAVIGCHWFLKKSLAGVKFNPAWRFSEDFLTKDCLKIHRCEFGAIFRVKIK